MKIMLLNDTGIVPHIGCLAVSDAHVRLLASRGHSVKYRYFFGQLTHFYTGNQQESINKVLNDTEFMYKIQDVDAIIVNGEGTIHHGAGLHYLAVLAAAQQLKKKTLIVNAVFQESYGFEDVLRNLDDFCVREILSSEFAASRGIKNRVVIDSYMAAQFDAAEQPYIDLSNKIVVTDWHAAKDLDTGNAITSYFHENKNRCFFFPLEHGIHFHLWRRAPQTIATCDFIITGRHHGIYLAAIARKPFVALPSNTHKIEGLIKMSGIPIPVCRNMNEMKKGIDFCIKNRTAFDEFFAFLASHLPLSTFEALGTESPLAIINELAQLTSDTDKHSYAQSASLWPLSSFTFKSEFHQLVKSLKGLLSKKVVLFGTGSTSQELYKLLPATVHYCVDNNFEKYNDKFEGLIIKSPHALLTEDKEHLAIIIASQYYDDIAKQLRDMDFVENVHFWNGFQLLQTIKQ